MTTRILLSTTSYQDTPGSHHELLESQGWDVVRKRGPLNEQQMLAIGRALMTNPTLLMLDEATEGLAPVVRQEIWAAVATLKRESGLALLVVDKSLAELRQVADRAVILERGASVWSGRMDALDAAVADQYLGV